MLVCAVCGAGNPGGSRFCNACAAPFAGSAPPREARRTVTVLFCDVTGSTGLGERLDAESLRHVMARYFEVMRLVVERHGGTVEKFIGDAVMAVFGVPLLHEDDALRAVRAAAGMREALQELNGELGRDYGIALEARIGVNTGEVVTGTEERLVTGDAVNVAARLQQAAQPGEVLLGEGTFRLVRHAVEVESAGPLELKGKSGPLAAFRLLRVSAEAETISRRRDGPMVGRGRESRMLADAWERVCSERACHLFTLLGTAGVGKSRLVREFLEQSEATVLVGRCLSYGEGVTYWPVVEVVKQLVGAEPLRRLGELLSDPVALTAIGSLVGESGQPTSPEEIAWAVRKLLEATAAEAPLVVVFDDVQWGEQTFLDLVEHVADLSRGAPILLLCMGRPELLDHRPGWGSGTMNAARVLLEPLSREDTDELIEGLLGEQEITAGLRERIRDKADGNPLFVEEMLMMLRDGNDDGDAAVVVPPTIRALLAARLDQLDPLERQVLERGSVEGQVFHQGALEALAPEEQGIPARLVALVRRELVRPEAAMLAGEDAFRFRHLLVRDAAYDSLAKASRARLHEGFADWLDERAGDLVERDEIVGYHLEQAHLYHAQLGPLDEHGRDLGRRGAQRLGLAAQTAQLRGDMGAAVNLLERVLALRPGEPLIAERVYLTDALLNTGNPQRAAQVASDAVRLATDANDKGGALRARIANATLRQTTDSDTVDQLAGLAQEGLDLFAQVGDDAGLADAYGGLASVAVKHGRWEDHVEALEAAHLCARRAGNPHLAERALSEVAAGLHLGPRRAVDVLVWFEEHGPTLGQRYPSVLEHQAAIEAMLGLFDQARAHIAEAGSRFHELGMTTSEATLAMGSCVVELLAGDPEAAEQVAREGSEFLEGINERGWLSTLVGQHGEALIALNRYDEAEKCAQRGKELAAADDVISQVLWRQNLARVLSHRGEHPEAERLAREAVQLAEPTTTPTEQGHTHSNLAHVLAAAGKIDEAIHHLERALSYHRAKGNLVTSAKTEAVIAEFRAAEATRAS